MTEADSFLSCMTSLALGSWLGFQYWEYFFFPIEWALRPIRQLLVATNT